MHTRTSRLHQTKVEPPVGQLISELRAELGCARDSEPLEPQRAAAPRSLPAGKRRAVVEATKLLTIQDLARFPTEGDEHAFERMAREYLAHYGFADTVAELDRRSKTTAGQQSDTEVLQDKKRVLTFLNRVRSGGLFDTTDSIREAQQLVENICSSLPEDVAALLWLWWTLHVAKWAPEVVDPQRVMSIVLRGNGTGNMGSAFKLAEQCVAFVTAARAPLSQPAGPSRGWRRHRSPHPAYLSLPSNEVTDQLFKEIKPAIHRHYGVTKRPRGLGMPTVLEDVLTWNTVEERSVASRWSQVLAEE